ncbi:MAG: penicillin-binding protein 2 [Deltaproteobacteria bacterium]|nr:penicillin-binding protein 2 [Deltaproteobacteria bacterium]
MTRSTTPRRAAARWRVWVVAGVVVCGFAGVLWKSARLQLVLGDDLRGLAQEQYLRKVSVTAPRGTVQDVSGRALAVSVPAWSVYAEPRRIVDVDATAQTLGEALGLPASAVASRIANDRAFVWLERRVAPDVAERVRALDLPGVGTRKEWRRTWPNKQLAAQVLGGVDVDGAGRGGIEQSLDDRLTARSTRLSAIADNKGDRIATVDAADPIFDLDSLAGDDVVLTLDLALSQATEEILERTRASFQAKAAWAIVLDVKTGGVRTVAQSPAFNPNNGEGDKRNHAFADAFEPGSIFKVATFAAALDAGVVNASDLIDCENGRYQLGRHVIHDTHKTGVISAAQVFATSSNIGTLKIAGRLGEERFKTSLKRYGFGERSGTGLLDESSGRLPAQARWGDARTATISFGHGVLVSSLQMASMVQAVANDGVRMRPYLVERVVTKNGDVIEQHEADGGERVMTSSTAKTLLSIMEGVVLEGGTGTLAAVPGIRVAGKTGTAEKVDPLTGRYSKALHLSSFVGVAPADDPQIVVIVVVDEPKGLVFGGQNAAPAFAAIVERALLPGGRLGLASLDASLQKTKKLKRRASAAIVDVGDGPRLSAAEAVAGAVPDLRGLSARAAMTKAAAAGFEITLSGSGLVSAQDVDDSVIALTLAAAGGPR